MGQLPASFRDPSGFVFARDGVVYRQVNQVYRADYDHLMSCGLYADLAEAGLLVAHRETDVAPEDPAVAYKVLVPQRVPFISYPYEWCFSQLRDAALATLAIQRMALDRGMSLKDASAYNIQFARGRPVLLDTLSFERAPQARPWVAYRQFCTHFLAPLALMSRRDVRLGQLLRVHIDGIPLDLAARLLPWRTRLSFALATHVHLHARSQQRYAGKPVRLAGRAMSRTALLGLLDNLRGAVAGLRWQPAGTEWGDYSKEESYAPAALQQKQRVVEDMLARVRPATVWDLGANTGAFSRIAARQGAEVISFDVDPAAVEKNYREVVRQKETQVLPLVLDLANPSPGLGWHHRERTALLERGPADLVLALALLHHLAISNNVPLERVTEFMADAGRWLIMEFVPKDDPQVQRLLATRADVFPGYTRDGFERAFARRYDLREAVALPGSTRRLYLMERRPPEAPCA